MHSYDVKRNNRVLIGSFSEETIVAAIQTGSLTGNDYVLPSGENNWIRIADLEAFAPFLSISHDLIYDQAPIDQAMPDKEAKTALSEGVVASLDSDGLNESQKNPKNNERDPFRKQKLVLGKLIKSKWFICCAVIGLFLSLTAVPLYIKKTKGGFGFSQLKNKHESLPEPFKAISNEKDSSEKVSKKESGKQVDNLNKKQNVIAKTIPGLDREFINLRNEIVRYGYDEDHVYSLGNFASFGSNSNANLAQNGDPFQKGDAIKRASDWKNKLQNYFFFADSLNVSFPRGTNFEDDGIVLKAILPFKLPFGMPEPKNLKTTGMISALNCQDYDEGYFAFLTKDGQLRECTNREAVMVKNNNGILYMRESYLSYVNIVLRGEKEILKNFYKNKDKCVVECGFTSLRARTGEIPWGYFNLDTLQTFKMNTDTVRSVSDLRGLIEKQVEDYFVVDAKKSPSLLIAKPLYILVKDFNGDEVGSVFFKE